MAEEPHGEGLQQTAANELRPEQISAIPPLALDKNASMPYATNQASDDAEERHQLVAATRTLFHQQRGDDDTLNSTRSLYDSDVVYHEIYGRRYCKDYFMPNDEDEQTRLQMLNGVYYIAFGKRHTTVDLQHPTKILDVGTGTGEWAMAIGDEYPEAEVIGIDIAKIQPSAVPLNVFFEIDDAEEEGGWTWPDNEFDLIHFRYMCGAFADWRYIYKEAYKHLKPGGWIEVVDFDDHKGLMGFFEEGSEVPRWLEAVNEGSERLGRPRTTEYLEVGFAEELGFVEVKSTDYVLPLGVWRDDKEGQMTGKHFLVATVTGVEALCLRILTEQMGWDYNEVQRIAEIVQDSVWQTALDPEKAKGMGFRVKVLTARKPDWTEEGEERESLRTTPMPETIPEGVNGAAS